MGEGISCLCHVWIGTTALEEDEYRSYFRLDSPGQGDYDDPNRKRCGFCLDLGIDRYDEDFICIAPLLAAEEDAESLLKKTPIRYEEICRARQRCTELGIEKANAVFCYSVPKDDDPYLLVIDIDPRPDKVYNGLTYLGAFEE